VLDVVETVNVRGAEETRLPLVALKRRSYVPAETEGSAAKVNARPEVGKVKGEPGVPVTPDGRPERPTLTVPEKPKLVVSARFISAVEFGNIVTCPGAADIEKDWGGGGGEEVEEPLPPQPQVAARILPKRPTNIHRNPFRRIGFLL